MSIINVAIKALNYPISMGYIILARTNRKLDNRIDCQKILHSTQLNSTQLNSTDSGGFQPVLDSRDPVG
jgi:hypothetical protein